MDNFIFRPAALNVSRPTDAMITRMNELEPLLGQYDPGIILVGPLLSLSMSSSYRYFYLAGNGDKVCETVALGFVEDEADAQNQRADIVEKLGSRFEEVKTFGGHLEMAHAVHTRWPNKETEKFLALAEREVMSKPAAPSQQKSTDDNDSYAGVVPGKEPVDSANWIDDNLTHVPPGARDNGQAMPVLRPAEALTVSSVPIAALSQSLRDDRAVTVQQRHTGLSQDDLASAILRLKSPAEREGIPRPPVEDNRSLASTMLRYCAFGGAVALTLAVITWAIVRPSTRQVADEAAPAPVPAQSITVHPNDGPSQAAAVPPSDPNYVTEVKEPALRAEPAPATVPPSQLASGQAGAEPVSVPPSPPSEPSQVTSVPLDAVAEPVAEPQSLPVQEGSAARHLDAEDIAHAAPAPVPAQSITVNPNDGPSQAAAVPSSDPNHVTEVKKPATVPPSQLASGQAGAEPVSVPPSPPSGPSQVASVPLGAVAEPVAEPQSLPVQAGSTALHLDAEEIATLVNRGTDSLKSGDLASARLLLRRAAEAGSASAALMLGTTFDPLYIRELGAIGVVPDVAQARRWYEKASALGSETASQRLAKLAQTGR